MAPMKRSDYPPDWPAISKRVREAAGQMCEWCGVANGAVGARDRHGDWHADDDIHAMNSSVGEDLFAGEFPRMVKMVLTVAHIHDPDPMNCEPENLKALCNRCHLNHDRAHHIAQARERRRRERGQLAMDGVG